MAEQAFQKDEIIEPILQRFHTIDENITRNNQHNQEICNNFNYDCNSISTCVSINRITQCLQFYQSIDLSTNSHLLINYFNKNNYPFLINDYNHILTKHLGDNKPIKQTRNEYEQINQFIMSQIKHCQLEKCNKLNRNTRNREKEPLLDTIQLNNTNNDTNDLLSFYIDILDTIHCYLIHSFDIGYRIKSNELQLINDQKQSDKDQDDILNINIQDPKMEKLKQILHTRRNKLNNIRQRNKFTTETKKTDEIKDDTSNMPIPKSKSGCYSFGSRFYYWPKYKGLKDIEHEGPNEGFKYKAFYIKPKYENIRDEIINNNTCNIQLIHFNTAYIKAEQFMECKYVKKLFAYGSLCNKYGIKENSLITIQHLLSLILYTDYDVLSYNFSSTFRKLNSNEKFGQQKRRNKEYAIWSKLLRETVELYGTEMTDSKIDIFYHGVSKLVFSSFVCFLGSPTSTTAQIEVATVFASQKGLILELRKSSRSLKYFNCTILSCYGNEDERLFIGGLFPIQFSSIREMNNNNNYKYFIHSLTSFNYSINGQQTFSSQHIVNKNDSKMIKSLLKYYNLDTKKIPVYINDIFKQFCETKKIIKINQQRLDPIMGKLLFKKECDSLIKLNIFNVFVNLEKISIEYDMIFKPMLNQIFFELMLTDLCECKINNNVIIELNKVEYDDMILNKYKSEFEKFKWQIDETGNVKNKSLEISYAHV